MSAAANLGSIGTGMTVGFSAVALPALQSPTHDPVVTDEEASWIGKTSRNYPVRCEQSECSSVFSTSSEAVDGPARRKVTPTSSSTYKVML